MLQIKKPLYEVSAPLGEGQKIGRVDVYENNKLLFTEELVSKNSVEKKGLFKGRFNKIKSFFLQSN